MTPWADLTARAALLPDADIDTDRILPARFMKGLERDGFGAHLFADARAADPRFAIGADRAILVTGANFGAGSSREHAVWALVGHGIRCVIAPSFGSIFAGNAASNGLLLATVGQSDHDALVALLAGTPDSVLTVDLVAQTITGAGTTIGFAIDPTVRAALLDGLDDIGRTLRHTDAIDAYERT